MEADCGTPRLHPEGVVTYTIDGRINYSNSTDSVDFEHICDGSQTLLPRGHQW